MWTSYHCSPSNQVKLRPLHNSSLFLDELSDSVFQYHALHLNSGHGLETSTRQDNSWSSTSSIQSSGIPCRTRLYGGLSSNSNSLKNSSFNRGLATLAELLLLWNWSGFLNNQNHSDLSTIPFLTSTWQSSGVAWTIFILSRNSFTTFSISSKSALKFYFWYV